MTEYSGIYSSQEHASDLQPQVDGINEDGWLHFKIKIADGGEFDPVYGLRNVLLNDRTVYSTRSRMNVNILLEHISSLSSMRAAPFSLHEVCIRVPASGFTSPLKNGFIFACSAPVELKTFDDYDKIETGLLLGPHSNQSQQALPRVPSCVRTVLYFHLDRNATVFRYRFQNVVQDARYIYIKLLDSFGSHDNIDIEFIGFKGSIGKLSFPFGSLV
jgi:hypothetical protein